MNFSNKLNCISKISNMTPLLFVRRCFPLSIFLTVSLIITLQVISGYTVTAANDVKKEELSREEVQNEVPDSERLYRYKCSLCHELPDIDAYSSYERWINVMNAMHEPGRYNESVNAEDDALLKDYLRTMSQK